MKITNKSLILALVWIFFALTQVTLVSSLSIHYSEVNLVVANILLWEYFGAKRNVVWVGAVLAGLTLDIFSPLFFGAVTLLLSLITGLSYYIHSRLAQYLTHAILLVGCFLAVVIYDVGAMLLAGMTLLVPLRIVVFDGLMTMVFAALEITVVLIVARIIKHSDRNLLSVRGV